MIPFRQIQLSDKASIERLLALAEEPICDRTFPNLYIWQQTYLTSWAEVGGWLVVRYWLEEGVWGYMLVGRGDATEVVSALFEQAQKQGEPLRMVAMSRSEVEQVVAVAKTLGIDEEQWAVCDNAAYRDYIYSVEELCALRGRRFQPKRNHVNRFCAMYDYRFEILSREYFEECLRLESRWQRNKGESGQGGDERQAICRAFSSYEELGLLGGVLLVDGQVVAFTFGSAIDEQTFCTHVEKADSSFEGVFPMINRCFAELLQQRGFKRVNREEDMGLAGLRRSKQSYHPLCLQQKMGLKILSEQEVGCRELWQRVFGDEREFVDCFLAEYSTPDSRVVEVAAGHVVSMLHIVDITTSYGKTAYLYAIATAPEWRGRGLASRAVVRAIDLARERGYRAVMLIAADSSLIGFYERLGFGSPSYQLDFSDGFDFGTGNPERDVAMVIEL